MLRRPTLMLLLASLLALALAGCGAKQPEPDYVPPPGASSADGGPATTHTEEAPTQGTGRQFE